MTYRQIAEAQMTQMTERRATGNGKGPTRAAGADTAPKRGPKSSPVAATGKYLIAPKCLKVLVVDDSEDAAWILAELLQARGHVVRTALCGASALELLGESLSDVVLLDVGLPGMDGYEACAAIRARFGAKVKVVALTGFRGAEARERAKRAGFDAFVEKPFRIEDVEAVLAVRITS